MDTNLLRQPHWLRVCLSKKTCTYHIRGGSFSDNCLVFFSHTQSCRDQVPCNVFFVSSWEYLLTLPPFWMNNVVCLLLYIDISYQQEFFTTDTNNLVRPSDWWSTLHFSQTILIGQLYSCTPLWIWTRALCRDRVPAFVSHWNKQPRPPFLLVKYAALFTNQPDKTTLQLYPTLNLDESTRDRVPAFERIIKTPRI